MNSVLRSVLFAGAAALLLAPAAYAAGKLDAVKAMAEIDAGLDKAYPHLDALYKDIHAHPELGFQEVETAAKLAKEMRALGFEVTEHVGKGGRYGSVGDFGWGGAYYTSYWADPEEKLVALFMAQLRPWGDIDLHPKFRALVYQAIEGPSR